MCTQEGDYAADLYQRHGSTIHEYLQKTVLVNLQNTTSTTTCPTLFLQEVAYRWSNHCIMTKWLEKFFAYLSRTYIPQFNIPTLSQVGWIAFDREIYQPLVKIQATAAIMELIAQERQGHLVENKTLIKRIVNLYEAMGMDKLDVYHDDLELPLLQATREYYQQKCLDYISAVDFSTSQYLKMAEEALTQEKVRVTEYLWWNANYS
jgi:Cullin family